MSLASAVVCVAPFPLWVILAVVFVLRSFSSDNSVLFLPRVTVGFPYFVLLVCLLEARKSRGGS